MSSSICQRSWASSWPYWLVGRSWGGEKTHMMMDWEITRPKENGNERGSPLHPQRWLITGEVRGSAGTEGGRDGQSWGRRDGGEGKWREETDGAEGDGRAESSRRTPREEDGEGRRESGEWGMDPDVGRMDGWRDGWRGRNSNYRPCFAVGEMEELLFQHCHSALTQQNEIFSH